MEAAVVLVDTLGAAGCRCPRDLFPAALLSLQQQLAPEHAPPRLTAALLRLLASLLQASPPRLRRLLLADCAPLVLRAWAAATADTQTDATTHTHTTSTHTDTTALTQAVRVEARGATAIAEAVRASLAVWLQAAGSKAHTSSGLKCRTGS